MPNLNNRFQPDKLKHTTRPDGDLFPDAGPPPLRGVTRENYASRLKAVRCLKCGVIGQFESFENGPHIGLRCVHCGREHPLRGRSVMWLPGQDAAWKRGT